MVAIVNGSRMAASTGGTIAFRIAITAMTASAPQKLVDGDVRDDQRGDDQASALSTHATRSRSGWSRTFVSPSRAGVAARHGAESLSSAGAAVRRRPCFTRVNARAPVRRSAPQDV